MASTPPTSSETTAATAFQRISLSAGSWNTSPVEGSVLNIRFTAMFRPLYLTTYSRLAIV